MPLWKKAVVAVSVAVSVVGLSLWGYAAVTAPDAPPERSGAVGMESLGAAGFMPGDPAAGGESGSEGEGREGGERPIDVWSPAVFRLGFSFFVGFCIAYALRTFVKASLVVIGVMLLALFGLQYAGVIDVDWSAMEGHYQRLTAKLSAQTASFQRFITGYLPSSASAALGLVVGFRRN